MAGLPSRQNDTPAGFDEQGNPLIQVGCPNCGKGKGTMGGIEFAAARNSGRDPAGPCSQRCKFQLEYADELAADRLKLPHPSRWSVTDADEARRCTGCRAHYEANVRVIDVQHGCPVHSMGGDDDN